MRNQYFLRLNQRFRHFLPVVDVSFNNTQISCFKNAIQVKLAYPTVTLARTLMQLTLSALSKKSPFPLNEILSVITNCKCNILELRTTQFSPSVMSAYALVEGDWHCLAKLENGLENLQKRAEIKIHTLQVEPETRTEAYIPYSLKSISIDHSEMIQEIVIFLTTHAIIVQDIKGSCYPAPYTDSPLFATEFIILIHEGIQLLSFREELLSFCDGLNLDAIFEPLKR